MDSLDYLVKYLQVSPYFDFMHSFFIDVPCSRKFFTFVFGINMIGLGLAASGHFPYAVKYSGAMVVGNLNFAILMRNEIFGRLLYLFVNTFFAKVREMIHMS